MKNTFKYIGAIMLIFIMISCTKDFIVKDIKNSVVTIIAPADNLSTPNNLITFWWEEVDGAENYSIQIVKPSFNSVQQLIADTTVIGTKFNYTFTPGTYQWRIRANNSGGSTSYFTRTLTIDTTSNLSNVIVSVNSPVDNFLTKSKTINFSWNPLNAAAYYELEVKDASGGIVLSQSQITSTTYTYTFINSTDVVYTWRVRAFNLFSFSQYNTPRTFYIDITPPVVSQIISPSGGISVKDTTYFKWNRISTDTKYDSIIVSYDSLGASYIASQKVYATQLKINSFPLTSPGPATGYYWWRIISVDSVRNISNSSISAKFKLN